MFTVPVFLDLKPAEYERTLATGRDLNIEQPRLHRHDSGAIQATIDGLRDAAARHRQQVAILESRIILERRKLRLVRQHEANAGWPVVERRTHSRGSGRT